MELKISIILLLALVNFVSCGDYKFRPAKHGDACNEALYTTWKRAVPTYPPGSFKHGLYLQYRNELDEYMGKKNQGERNKFAQDICLTSYTGVKDKNFRCEGGKCGCHSTGEFSGTWEGSYCKLALCATCFEDSQCSTGKCIIKPGRNFYQCFKNSDADDSKCTLANDLGDEKDNKGWKKC